MTEDDRFTALLERIRSGDQDAQRLLFEKYDAPIRRAVRMRIMHSRMRRLMDSEDIRQSVMKSFFLRFERGDLEFSSPGQLVGLLLEMTRNKVADHVRKAVAVKRGGGEDIEPLSNASFAFIDDSPLAAAIESEISTQVNERLDAVEKELIQLRREGADWKQIGLQCQMSPEAARKRYHRMVDRISKEMGLDESLQAD